jgi:hypoxanthine phosphoribosyltransferase
MSDRKVVINKKQIHEKVDALAAQISADYSGKDLILTGVLNGAFIFLADLARAITIPHQIDFIRVASYGNNDSSSGTITLTKDIELDCKDKHVLLVEDIIDTGATLDWLTNTFKDRDAASVRICALINKKERRISDIPIDYIGFSLERGFLIGYGLDYAQQYRHLPEIYTLHP